MTIFHRKYIYIYLLIAIIASGAFLRIFMLGTIPAGFFRDEAWNGYQAYSILKTGRDTGGNLFPLFFSQYGVIHFSSLYIYTAVPFIYLFGLNEFAARLPAAVFGILTIWMAYLCVKEFFGRRIALITAFLLSISPWHIQFSRMAFRAITLPFFFLLALYLLQRSRREKKCIYWGGAVLGLTIYTYSSANLFVPLALLGWIVINGKYLLTIKKELIIAFLIFAVIVVPLVRHGLTPEGQAHFRGDSYMSKKFRTVLIPFYLREFTKRYAGYYSPMFLFVSGQSEAPWPSPWEMGQLYLFKLPLILIGLYIFIKRRTRAHITFLLWLCIYPVTAAVTAAFHHPLRTITVIPVFQVLAAQGAYSLFQFCRNRSSRWITAGYLFLLLAFGNVGYFVYSYLATYPRSSAEALQYGYRDAIGFIESIREEGDLIRISKQLTLAYIFVLFYTKHDPAEYQASPVYLSSPGKGFKTGGRIGDYHFSYDPAEGEERPAGRLLSLSSPCTRKHWSVLKTIYYPDGPPALQVSEGRL